MLLGSSDATGSNESWHRADATPAHDKHSGVEGQGYMTTLQKVLGDREWESQKHGKKVSIKLDFGSFQAELNTNPETLSSRLEMCEAWIGKESSEWAFEDKGTWNNGNPKPKKVLSWPGKVAYSGAQEPRRAPNTRSTSGGAEQPSILASVALKAAVELALKDGVQSTVMPLPDSVLAVAEYFNDWLINKASGSAKSQGATIESPLQADPDPSSTSGNRESEGATLGPSAQVLSPAPAVGAPSAAEAHSGPSAGPSTSAGAEDSDPDLSPFTGSNDRDEGAP